MNDTTETAVFSNEFGRKGVAYDWQSLLAADEAKALDHDLASLAKTSTQRPVGDMKFGDRRDCDQMVERIRAKIGELKQQKTLADQVKRRTDLLLVDAHYRNDTDTVPDVDSVQLIPRVAGAQLSTVMIHKARLSNDAPLRINVVADDYWDLASVMR